MLSAATVMLTLLPIMPTPVARADGPAVVDVSIQPVNIAGNPLTDWGHTSLGFESRLYYRVSFSCAVEICTDTEVTISPSAFDPTWGEFQLLEPQPTEWTSPFPGASISGTAADGVTVDLGDLNPGQAGTFTVPYSLYRPPQASQHNRVTSAAYFPPGFQIEMSATITSANSDNPANDDASPVTWNINVPSGPGIAKSSPGTVDPDTEVTYRIRLSSGCLDGGGSNSREAVGSVLCAQEFSVTDVLPEQAVFVRTADHWGNDDGVYDPDTHTITWDVSGSIAAVAWGHVTTFRSSPGNGISHRDVTVIYPADNFPEADGGADFEVPVTNSVSVDMTYLDGSAGSASAQVTHNVVRASPFGRAVFSTKIATGNGSDGSVVLNRVPPDTTGMTCPAEGQDDWGRNCTPGEPLAEFADNLYFWQHDTYNQANVPGVAIVEDDLDHPGTEVYAITTSPVGAEVEWELDDGTIGTGTTNITSAPEGRHFVWARVTSPELAGPNINQSGGASTLFRVRFSYRVPSTAPIGEERTNTISSTMTYPDYPELDDITNADTANQFRTIRFVETPVPPPPVVPLPRFRAQTLAPQIEGGGTAVPGRDVTFTVRGVADRIPDSADITPQYVFVAPEGWAITQDSAEFDTAVTAGVNFLYHTVTINGVERDAVVASWPNTVSWGSNVNWPYLSVVAQPTFAVTAGTTSVAHAYMGDSRHTWDDTEAEYWGEFQDAPDLDADGVTAEWFASISQNVLVGASSGMGALKEICRPDASEADGCAWFSNPDVLVGAAPDADDIRYRITLTNTGNSNLSDIVGYDVLPHVGDFGTSEGAAGSPRGSTVGLALADVSGVSPGLALEYSPSTNPCRVEVYPSGPADCDPDWSAPLSGAASIRMSASSLAPGESVSFEYTAALEPGAPVDAVACNSVAASSNQTLAIEPSNVCATTQEADFGITTIDRFPLQEGRVGVVPFVVENHGGSATAGAVVDFTVPAGVSLVDLDIPGWDCSATSMSGPADVTCDPVDGDGTSRTLDRDVPETVELRVIPDAGTGDTELCFFGSVTGLMHDPVEPNNEIEVCSLTVDGQTLISVAKTDGVTVASPGDTLTYTIDVSNLSVAEGVDGAVIVDTLPENVEFVAASNGGVPSGADADGLGGIVTWPAVDLAPAGTETSTGDDASGSAGSTITRTVTVRVSPEAMDDVVNLVEVNAPDPADPDTQLTAEDEDVDGLRRVTVTKMADPTAAGVRAGDVVTYTVTLSNDGTVDYTAGSPATLVDDLSGVLDDADFVSGSASASVDGGASAPVADPDGSGLLSWSGPLAVGSTVEVTYQVSVGDGTSGDRVLTNTIFASGEPNTCTDGFDESGLSCATYTTVFAPVLAKLVDSVSQNDDGTWTVVYGLVVTNLSPISDSSYDLSDEVALGSGIQLVDADVTSTPGGVTAEPWSGSGSVATGVSIPADGQHFYQVTVVADPADTVGSPAGSCFDGLASGFANTAQIELTDGRTETAEACAVPVAPEVTKTAADTVQLADGRWSTVFTVTVSNPHGEPESLAYTLEDVFAVPSGITVDDVIVDGPVDAPINPGFDGTTDTDVFTGADRVPAGSTRVFAVTLVTDAPAGAAGASQLACPPAGTGGYSNQVTLFAGTGDTALDEDSACANAPTQPMPEITKEVVSSAVDVSGVWTLVYEIAVTNPSGNYSTEYTLTDRLQFADGTTVTSAEIDSAQVVPAATWNGESNIDVVTDETLAAGATHSFTVTVTADPGTIDTESAAADCRVDIGESGTGFRNLAVVTSGNLATFADACEPITDPSVIKTTVGQPTQDPDTGVWAQTYRVRVTNRSTTTDGEIPYTLVDFVDFPSAVSITDVTVTGPATATVNDAFDGSTDTDLASAGIGAAPDESTPAIQDYFVTVHFEIPSGLSTVAQCDPLDGFGGLRNEVEIHVGQRISGDMACADVPDVPVPGLVKTVVGQEQQADGTWLVDYEIVVANPSDTAASRYTLSDEFAFGDGIVLAEPAQVVSQPTGVTPENDWNGDDATTLAEDILLPAGGSHTYTVRAVVDTGALHGSDPVADCVLDQDETGTGLSNGAMLDTGATTRSVSACASIFDPGVSKQVNGVPVQEADGSWLLSYTMTVTNTSDVPLSYGLVDELDFPAGTQVSVVSATGRPGSPNVEADWNGQSQTVLVADGTPLPVNTAHIFDVTVRAMLAPDQGSVADGWHNVATVRSGVDGVVTNEAEAAADIEVPELEIEKTVDAPEIIRLGDQVEYTVTITNTGVGDYSDQFPATVWDDLSGVLDDAELAGTPSVTPSTGDVGTTDDALWWSGALASGETVTVQYTVTVTGGGDANLANVAFVAAPNDDDPTAPEACEAPSCSSTSTGMPALSIEKTVSTSEATPGEFVGYTVRVTNTGGVDLTGANPATITDDLSGVLDDAFIAEGPEADIGTVDVSGSTLTWTGPLAAGDTATITYTVRVYGDTPNGAILHNVVNSDPTLAVLGTSSGSAETSTVVAAQTDNPGSNDDTVGSLPFTGADLLRLTSIAVLSLGLGFVFMLLARRRRESEETH